MLFLDIEFHVWHSSAAYWIYCIHIYLKHIVLLLVEIHWYQKYMYLKLITYVSMKLADHEKCAPSIKCSIYEMSHLWISFSMKCPIYEMSYLWNLLSMKVLSMNVRQWNVFLCTVLSIKYIFLWNVPMGWKVSDLFCCKFFSLSLLFSAFLDGIFYSFGLNLGLNSRYLYSDFVWEFES